MVERKIMTGQGYGWVLVDVRGCVAVDAGHGLVTLLSLSVSVKDRSLHKTLGKSQIYYPNTYLCMGAWKICCSLVVGFGSFRTDCQGFVLVEEVLAPH